MDKTRPAWEYKAEKIISELCLESYKQANYFKNGQKKKKHVPYSVPAIAQELLNCIKTDDEEKAKAIFIKLSIIPESAKDNYYN
jgi:hypothetical protein